MTIAESVLRLLTRELEGFRREVELFPDDETLWQTAPGVTNSVGNLAMHLAGNLQHYIGAVLGGTGYRRNRDLEFSRSSGTRAEVVEELKRAEQIIREVLQSLPEERAQTTFPEAVMGMTFNTGEFLMHLCAHAGFHLGQAGYLRRIVTQNSQSSGPLPLTPLQISTPHA